MLHTLIPTGFVLLLVAIGSAWVRELSYYNTVDVIGWVLGHIPDGVVQFINDDNRRRQNETRTSIKVH